MSYAAAVLDLKVSVGDAYSLTPNCAPPINDAKVVDRNEAAPGPHPSAQRGRGWPPRTLRKIADFQDVEVGVARAPTHALPQGGGAHGTFLILAMESRHLRERQSRTRVLLLQLLEGACGSRERALSMLRLALVRSGLDGVPDTPEKALVFVRAHLLGKLSEEVGPRLAMALVDDLVERLDEPPESGVVPVPRPSSAHRIAALSVRSAPVERGILLLVDRDALRRASVARSLVPAGWDVRTASSHEDLINVAGGREEPVAIVLAVEHPTAEGILRVVVANWPGAAVVLHGDTAQAPSSLLDLLLELRQVRVCTRDEPLLERVDALVEALLRGGAFDQDM